MGQWLWISKRATVSPDGCWIWNGARSGTGYGKITVKRKSKNAHRVVYEVLVGPIPEGLQLDHLCRNRLCVNPEHLEPVTQRENLLRGDTIAAKHAAKTECPKGHPYDEENTYHRKDRGGRQCRTCARESYVRSRGG